MPRYFIEVSYKGTAYSGFQIQQNGITIQSEIQKALTIYFKQSFSLTGSSRTDAGVHALQNYFHFDTDNPLPLKKSLKKTITEPRDHNAETKGGSALYNLNAILPNDIVIKKIFQVNNDAHCRFDAISREYQYLVYSHKDPFLLDKAYYFPYYLDKEKLNEAAGIFLEYGDFTSFSKRNTQVNNFICRIEKSEWIIEENLLVYNVKANRFLRGMVKGLVGTMLRVGTGKISLDELHRIINRRDCTQADFSVPPHGLFLVEVNFG